MRQAVNDIVMSSDADFSLQPPSHLNSHLNSHFYFFVYKPAVCHSPYFLSFFLFFPPLLQTACCSHCGWCVGVHSHIGFSSLIIRVCEAAYCVRFMCEQISLSAGAHGSVEAAERWTGFAEVSGNIWVFCVLPRLHLEVTERLRPT